MDRDELARSMALDFVYSIVIDEDEGEHAHDLVDESLGMGAEHLHEFLLHVAGIVQVVGRNLYKSDSSKFQEMCHRIKNAPSLIPENDHESFSNDELSTEAPQYDENFDDEWREKYS